MKLFSSKLFKKQFSINPRIFYLAFKGIIIIQIHSELIILSCNFLCHKNFNFSNNKVNIS